MMDFADMDKQLQAMEKDSQVRRARDKKLKDKEDETCQER